MENLKDEDVQRIAVAAVQVMLDDPERKFVTQLSAAIAEKMQERVMTDFYNHLGQGVWKLLGTGILYALIAVAVYGANRSGMFGSLFGGK